MKRSLSRPSTRLAKWGKRLTLAGLTGWIGYQSIVQSVALVLSEDQVAQAYALAPTNGHIEGSLAQQLIGTHDRTRAVALARSALRHDPTAVNAVVVLSVDAAMRGNDAEAERLLTYSQTLSRRDLPTQLMAIEMAVAREDINGALKNYDIALRTKNEAPALLFPVLTSALGVAEIRSPLLKILNKKPNWGPDFINYVGRSDMDVKAIATFFMLLQKIDFRIPAPTTALVIRNLLDKKLSNEAWDYYASINPSANRLQSRDPDFEHALESPSAFDWNTNNTIGMTSYISPDSKNGLFYFFVSTGNGGTLLQQDQALLPGNYILTGRGKKISQQPRSQPYWILQCRSGREIQRGNIPNSSQYDGRFQAEIHVPADCPVQTLALIARSTNDIAGISGQMSEFGISPASGGK